MKLAGFIVVILVVIFGVSLPLFWKWKFCVDPPQGVVDISSLLTIILALVAIFAGGTYFILSSILQAESAKEVRKETIKAQARLLTYSGFIYWNDYEINKKTQNIYRDMAIELTEYAYADYASKLEKLADKELQKLICDIKNNLAYYYAERQNPNDRDRALEYAEYIHGKIKEFPTLKTEWEDTLVFVRQRYSAKP